MRRTHPLIVTLWPRGELRVRSPSSLSTETLRRLRCRSSSAFRFCASSACFFCSWRLACSATTSWNSFEWLNMSCSSFLGAVCHAAFLKPNARLLGGTAASLVASVIERAWALQLATRKEYLRNGVRGGGV